MKTLILDGFNQESEQQAAVMAAVTDRVAEHGWMAVTLAPRDMTLAPCNGCFGCWTRTPGRCVQQDDSHLLCSRIMESDLVLVVTPVSFGGYSSAAKKAMDRIIGLISPFFTVVGGEVHHKPRYERVPALAALGINHGNCRDCPDIFRTLLHRNAVNFHAPAVAVAVAGSEDVRRDGLDRVTESLLEQVVDPAARAFPVRRISREEFQAGPGGDVLMDIAGRESRRALLLVGSPKARSTSSSLGDDLAKKLQAAGWQVDMLRVSPAVASQDRWRDLVAAAERADVVVLLSPLYVDSLPAPVTRALELMADLGVGRSGGRKRGLVTVVNNGFPEPFHSHTALVIARQFAREAGYEWMGGLAMGMGGVIDGRPLAEKGRMVRHVAEALSLTAAAIDEGNPVPAAAVSLMGRPFMPRWLYIAGGNWGWKSQARKNGVRKKLTARPYEPVKTGNP